ncbi:uncharacterized protein LOC128344821 [Hemicordylus capensis]|uniref:uncharacterized protein LOC128344821 n=1 Tax=Hemicordylus capensis TaxID=884348 RepID=UPI00230321AF|nr:uncharacterized protein LOC128344821 [Hemicordylus capensis]
MFTHIHHQGHYGSSATMWKPLSSSEPLNISQKKKGTFWAAQLWLSCRCQPTTSMIPGYWLLRLRIILESTVNSKGSSSQEICCRLALGKVAIGKVALERIFRCHVVSTPTKIRIVWTMVFSMTLYGCESWTLKKQDRKSIDTFELWCWRRLLRILWTARKTNKWIIEQINPEFSLEAQMNRLKMTGHNMRKPSSLEKSVTLRKVEGKRRRG